MNVHFKLYAVTDRKRTTPELFFSKIEAALTQGVRAIQIREKDLPPKELFRMCKEIKKLAGKFEAKVLVNDRCDVALGLDLDGVHLTERSLPAESARKLLGRNKLIGVSVHSHEGVLSAESMGADFVVLGPVAPTVSKPEGHAILSVDEFRMSCKSCSIPIFALGGIHVENCGFWLKQGAFGVAGISVWMDQDRWPELKAILGNVVKSVKKTKRISAILLAAGDSERVGKNKLLLPMYGKTVLENVIDKFCAKEIMEILVVVGKYAADFRDVIRADKVRWVFNPTHREGMSSSIIAGVRHLDPDCDAVFVTPADIPVFTIETVAAMIKALDGERIVIPVFKGRKGHPVLIERKIAEECLTCSSTKVLYQVVQDHRSEVCLLPVDDEGILHDLDTTEDFERMRGLRQ